MSQLHEGICLTCKGKFTYWESNKRGLYCSQACYHKDKINLSKQLKKARHAQFKTGISAPKISDKKLLELWEEFKTTNKTLHSIFSSAGYKRVPPKRLLTILPKGEYKKYKHKNKFHSNGYLFKRGSHYERVAKKELEKQGYVVIKSGGSKGVFDLWALGENKLKLIQVKVVKINNNFTTLKKSISDFIVPEFCQKELWVWIERKGWRKEVV